MLMKPTHTLMVRSWKENEVQLIQFPRTHTIVSPSPFALKLETFLRMNNIKYHNVNNDMKSSSKGQVPFIELNGQQFPDSNMCIEKLRTHFNLSIDAHLSTNERAQLRAFSMLIEESLFRCLAYDRGHDYGWLATDQGIIPHLSSFKKALFQTFIIKQIQSRIKKITHAQGYGRHTPEEIEDIAKKDLMAISTLLGDKPYLFGDNPTTLDATLYGHLAQFTDTPLVKLDTLKSFIETSTPNLGAFVKRMKERYWPDWAQITEHLALNPEDLEPKKEGVTAAGENGANGTNGAQHQQKVDNTTPAQEVTTTSPAVEGIAVPAQG